MKHIAITTILALTSAAAFAGGMPYVQAAPMSPAPHPTLWNWFAGGGVGYLTDNEEELYTAHVGIDLQNPAYGCGQAVFLEVGYANFDETLRGFDDDLVAVAASTGEVSSAGEAFPINIDLDIIPVTLNYKLECPISGPLSAYIGAGAGIAFVDLELSSGADRASDDDTSFYAQVFAGLVYNASEAFEIYGGGRWVYLDGVTLFGDKYGSQDDFVVELGGRLNF